MGLKRGNGTSPATPSTPWHTLDAQAVAGRLQTDPQSGLSAAAAGERLQRDGPNRIPEARRRHLWQMFLGQFTDFMILVLIAAAVVSGVVGEAADTIAILVIVVLNAVIGVVQEYRAERALAALKEMAAPDAQLVRDGHTLTVPATEVVQGDVVLLQAGDIVPADLRLVEAEALRADESALTGESQAVEKDPDTLDDPELALGDRNNLAFKGSLITHGRARGVVVATGLESELGRIASLLQESQAAQTPLQRRLARFGRRLAVAILGVCIFIFAAGMLRGEPLALMFLTAVSLAVAAIPEALPAVVTISLALGARKMIRRNALVRRLPAVETLGSVTYICADKTGTLTENRMHAERVVAGRLEGEGLTEEVREAVPWLGRALALNNDVEQDAAGDYVGDPTEVALVELAAQAGLTRAELEATYPREAEIPFDSEHRRMTTVHTADDGFVALVKGAPETLIPHCRAWAMEGEPWSQAEVMKTAEGLAGEGYRVLALAMRRLRSPDGSPDDDLELLGLVGLIDPPRSEAPQAVADCLQAGITPVMITGDHPGTALAIARRVGIADEAASVVTGPDLAAMDEHALAARVESTRVYARVNPAQKIRIVEALQARGQFAAMTGDGVNDAPALKRADIGVAMGQRGTDVAREAADMVLLDDDFATIVRAVREGRRIFDNIRKFIKDTMSSNSGEIWTLFLAPFLGLPIPLLPIHILWINLVTDGLPGLAFTAEPAERGIMKRPPRPPRESIFAHGMWQHILWFGLFVGGVSIASQAWAIGRGVEYWQTVVFTVLTLSQLFHSLAVRSESESLFTIGIMSNIYMLGAVLLTVALQLMVIYVPVFNPIFKTQPLPAYDLAVCFALASLSLVAVEFEKWLVRRERLFGTEAA